MRILAVAFLLLCAGCRAEPDFDERYAAAERRLQAQQQAIDAELAKRAEAAGPASPTPSSFPDR